MSISNAKNWTASPAISVDLEVMLDFDWDSVLQAWNHDRFSKWQELVDLLKMARRSLTMPPWVSSISFWKAQQRFRLLWCWATHGKRAIVLWAGIGVDRLVWCWIVERLQRGLTGHPSWSAKRHSKLKLVEIGGRCSHFLATCHTAVLLFRTTLKISSLPHRFGEKQQRRQQGETPKLSSTPQRPYWGHPLSWPCDSKTRICKSCNPSPCNHCPRRLYVGDTFHVLERLPPMVWSTHK